MRNAILMMVVVPLITAFTTQVAVASEKLHTRTWHRAEAIKQFPNTNAYAAPVQRDWSNLSEAAQTSGLAGH
jgi:hypothetical protein